MSINTSRHLSSATRRIAIVHDWLPLYGGAEKVLEQILHVYPEADLYSMFEVLSETDREFLHGKPVTTSFIQRLPSVRSRYRNYLPLMPLAVEQFDLSAYDMIITSSYAVAKGVITGPDQLHLCYCHSPIRYAWDMQSTYLRESKLETGPISWVARAILHYMRLWDSRTAAGVNEFIANSEFVARRIRKIYNRNAAVIYPPVDLGAFAMRPRETRDDYYLTVSRMVPYKRIDLIVSAFAHMPDKKLVVIGDGPDFEKVKAKATSNITLLGQRPTSEVIRHMQSARAFIFAAEEDFGIAPIEAQACGTPVIAFGKGGVTESVIQGETGWFFYEQTEAAIVDAVREFEDLEFDAEVIHQHAHRFSAERFRREFHDFAERGWQRFHGFDTSEIPASRAETLVANGHGK